jgi:predicted AlkP superfamily pyrophosphatase or phosphodiesterase
MVWYNWTLLLVIIFQILSLDGATQQLLTDIPRLLIISLDGSTNKTILSLIAISSFILFEGFGHQYFNAHTLPTFSQFRNEGVFATKGMKPTFTTMTYPNHVSIATVMFDDTTLFCFIDE